MYDMLADVGFPMTPVLAAIPVLSAAWAAVWPYLIMALGFSIIIFVHELGHFAVAKWAGVRVDRFAVGFGREIVGFSYRETRYSLNILPLGGYVKMLGQEDFDDKSEELKFKDDPDSFVNKPVSHRMAIVSAGVIMNILFACFLFMIVFLVGKQGLAPRIAVVEPDSPAERGGLAPGDRIRSVNGYRINTFDEVSMAVLLAPPHEPLEFLVDRSSGENVAIYVTPEYRRSERSRGGSRLMVGIGPGTTRKIIAVAPQIDTSEPDKPHVGDEIVEIDGLEVTDANVNEVRKMLAYTKGNLVVSRLVDPKDEQSERHRVAVTIPPRLTIYPSEMKDRTSVSVLGLTPLMRCGAVDPTGRAALAGIEEGDTVLQWDDQRHPNAAVIARAVRDNAEHDIYFVVQKSDGRKVRGFVRPKLSRNGAATIMAVCRGIKTDDTEGGVPRARFSEVRPGGVADRAGIAPGDVIVSCQGTQHPNAPTVNGYIRDAADRTLSMTLRHRDGSTYSTDIRPVSPGAIDASFRLIAEDVLVIADVLAEINGKPSPAATAGIPAGALVKSVGGQVVSNWTQLIDRFRASAGTTVDVVYAKDASEVTVSLAVPHSLRTILGIGPEARIVSVDGRKFVQAKTKTGTAKLAVRYHRGTHAILRELIGRNDVAVEFRVNPLEPVQTKTISVSEDMVDPWLARIEFQPNVLLAPEMTLVKGRNALDAIAIGAQQTYYFVMSVYETLNRMIFSRSVGVENISGPLGIVSMGGQVARMGMVETFFFMAIISANLAVINFLPLPIVDGGMMVFLIVEKIKGSPVSLKVQVATQMIGVALLAGIFLFVTYQDVLRLWG